MMREQRSRARSSRERLSYIITKRYAHYKTVHVIYPYISHTQTHSDCIMCASNFVRQQRVVPVDAVHTHTRSHIRQARAAQHTTYKSRNGVVSDAMSVCVCVYGCGCARPWARRPRPCYTIKSSSVYSFQASAAAAAAVTSSYAYV